MKLKAIYSAILATATLLTVPMISSAATNEGNEQQVVVQQIRNAAVKITYDETTFLVDPMLAEKGAYPGLPGTINNEIRNPKVELPLSVENILADVDAVVLTHATHPDHWDDAAVQLVPKTMPIIVQNDQDASLVRAQGFTDVRLISDVPEFKGVTLHKTRAKHGTDAIYSIPPLAEVMGEGMGIVFEAPGRKTVYVAGDTIWFDGVDKALSEYQPDIIILNTGLALTQALPTEENAIIMGPKDTLRAYNLALEAKIIAVHMDAINHMTVSRESLSQYVIENNIGDRVLIPEDGEIMKF